MRWILPIVAMAVCSCGTSSQNTEPQPPEISGSLGSNDRVVQVIRGRASWYGGRFHGRRTASGERFDKHKLTAASRTLKFGTRVRVTNERNGKVVVLRVNDRGPYGKDRRRVIDVSEAAAEKLSMKRAGVVPVKIEVLGP